MSGQPVHAQYTAENSPVVARAVEYGRSIGEKIAAEYAARAAATRRRAKPKHRPLVDRREAIYAAEQAELERVRIVRERGLKKLLAEGYAVDVEDELPEVLGLDEAQYAAYQAKVRRCYRRTTPGPAARQLTAAEQAQRLRARESELRQLRAAGKDLDVAEELESVAAMPVAQYAAHIERIKKYHAERPFDVPEGEAAIRYCASAGIGRLPVAQAVSRYRAAMAADEVLAPGATLPVDDQAIAPEEMGLFLRFLDGRRELRGLPTVERERAYKLARAENKHWY